MSVLESIIRDLRCLPLRELVEVARHVHRLNTNAEKERAEALRETHGYLNDEEASIFEESLDLSRRIESRD